MLKSQAFFEKKSPADFWLFFFGVSSWVPIACAIFLHEIAFLGIFSPQSVKVFLFF